MFSKSVLGKIINRENIFFFFVALKILIELLNY